MRNDQVINNFTNKHNKYRIIPLSLIGGENPGYFVVVDARRPFLKPNGNDSRE